MQRNNQDAGSAVFSPLAGIAPGTHTRCSLTPLPQMRKISADVPLSEHSSQRIWGKVSINDITEPQTEQRHLNLRQDKKRRQFRRKYDSKLHI
ncbi:MAG: hypothetical protein DRI57_07620 [Deltaproteobacteria bacterium]|nr:MAG: hypothetical protein DRI57_07620 [Deltaproteobacteria bacterium]